MNNKNILYLLFALILFINFYLPASEENDKKVKKLNLVKEKIVSEKAFEAQQDTVLEKVKELEGLLNQNKIYFIEEEKTIPEAMNLFQTAIRDAVKKSGVIEVNMGWGEPFSRENSFYTVLPLEAVIDAAPEQIASYIAHLSAVDYIMSAEFVSLLERRKLIRIKVNLNAFKLGVIKGKENE